MSFDYRRNFQVWQLRQKARKEYKCLFTGCIWKNIFENSVPVWTADGSENPYVVLPIQIQV